MYDDFNLSNDYKKFDGAFFKTELSNYLTIDIRFILNFRPTYLYGVICSFSLLSCFVILLISKNLRIQFLVSLIYFVV